MVRFNPSRNRTFGSHPRSFLASELSATRFSGPVGISGRSLISALCPVNSQTILAQSITRIRSMVPRLTAVPSLVFSPARSVDRKIPAGGGPQAVFFRVRLQREFAHQFGPAVGIVRVVRSLG